VTIQSAASWPSLSSAESASVPSVSSELWADRRRGSGPVSPQAIRVAHLIHTLTHGGVETALINWMRTFDRARIEPRLLCLVDPRAREQPFVRAAAAAGIASYPVPWGRLKPVWKSARVVAGYVREHKINLLHCHNTYANAVGLLARSLVGVKVLTTVYVWSGYGTRRRILQAIDRRLIPHFDQVTAHCDASLRDTVERGIPPHRVRLLTCGFAERVAHFDTRQRTERRAEMGVAADDTVLIKVARFWPEKRHDVMLDALRLLLRQNPHIRLWLPGVGPQRSRAEVLASQLGLKARVDFLGFRTDLPELLALADIQVHTSDEEGVPLAILSGMAGGLPIIATKVGGIPEVIEHGKSGVMIQPGNPQAVATAVIDLVADVTRRRALGLQAQRFIENEYSLAGATARVEALYAELVAR
jgi:glycosyltransferase involved in cell wall biosynthesis